MGKKCQGVQEGQRSSGRLEILQEGNLKGAGVGYLQVLEVGWNSEKKKKKRVHDLLKKGQEIQEDYSDIMRLAGSKLELK